MFLGESAEEKKEATHRVMMGPRRTHSLILIGTSSIDPALESRRRPVRKRDNGPTRFPKMGRSTMNSLKMAESSNELFPVVVSMIQAVSAKAKQASISPQSLLLEELALDSLDLVRVIMLMEDRYHVAIDLDEVPKMKQVNDLTILLGREIRTAA
jgi:acyl carrier protein